MNHLAVCVPPQPLRSLDVSSNLFQGSSNSSVSQNVTSPQHARRRSTVLMNLQLNDPSVPGPGEMVSDHIGHQSGSPQPLWGSPLLADPHHHRAPSLGELHQELEAEQEAHVVCMASFCCVWQVLTPRRIACFR